MYLFFLNVCLAFYFRLLVEIFFLHFVFRFLFAFSFSGNIIIIYIYIYMVCNSPLNSRFGSIRHSGVRVRYVFDTGGRAIGYVTMLEIFLF